jgi:hypothetical protein
VITLTMRILQTIGSFKYEIYEKTRIPVAAQVLRYKGKFLEDTSSLNDFNIVKDSLLRMSGRLCGGNKDKGCSLAPKLSYKDLSQKTFDPTPLSHAYIVESAEKTHLLELKDPSIEGIHDAYATQGIICRFNGLWSKTIDMYKWIHTSWT